MPFTASDICKIILAIILPPLGVFLERGCVADFWINVLLTILGYLPGYVPILSILMLSSFYDFYHTLTYPPKNQYHPRLVHHSEVLDGPAGRTKNRNMT
ncbi:plasma membrane proteolipid Pmp3, variant 2 [Orbilia oligospora]|nr:plasma membrane proteolipid Pmp3, variant 2 [Orbilia oligospora]KAF3128322.1 plasma membrane proteolipid Pmp3, variant 2 [Orbilia oligospora]KAF3158389.1 plasma membrane proteolipid Pmp3, variant 2 [Orbilia oligospora]KAF3172728.1 plasma membrane proteolipid Pmp3, variant 2 [Orbilia oligospora]KAF3271193.1 plasma membrane proteolipid Pmp3, variant 2 [Orbilia oligospora]